MVMNDKRTMSLASNLSSPAPPSCRAAAAAAVAAGDVIRHKPRQRTPYQLLTFNRLLNPSRRTAPHPPGVDAAGDVVGHQPDGAGRQAHHEVCLLRFS
jgi:hypothetical protein